MKIETVYLKKLRNEAHFEFFHDTIALINKFPEVKSKLGILYEQLTGLTKNKMVSSIVLVSKYLNKGENNHGVW